MSGPYDGLKADGYDASWELAWKRFKDVLIEKRGPDLGSTKRTEIIVLPVLDGKIEIDLTNETVGSGLPEFDRFLGIVVLHYLASDRGTKWDGQWSLFRQMPGGESFHHAFQQRIIKPLAKEFSSDPEALERAGKRLHGSTVGFGDSTVVLPFLPELEIMVTVWRGDDEVDGSATMLFPSSAARTLPTEDLVEVGSVALKALRRAAFN